MKELCRYLGFANYLAVFLKQLADIAEPLRNLTRTDVPQAWAEPQQKAFETIAELITSAPLLAFYDPSKELTLKNDASKYGLGAALFQEGHPVAFTSHSPTPTERRYAQTEKGSILAVKSGLEKFHYYTYGQHTQVITDHKPLVAKSCKPLSATPLRLQNRLLRSLTYNYKPSHKPGKSIPLADTLSCAPPAEQPCR